MVFSFSISTILKRSIRYVYMNKSRNIKCSKMRLLQFDIYMFYCCRLCFHKFSGCFQYWLSVRESNTEQIWLEIFIKIFLLMLAYDDLKCFRNFRNYTSIAIFSSSYFGCIQKKMTNISINIIVYKKYMKSNWLFFVKFI